MHGLTESSGFVVIYSSPESPQTKAQGKAPPGLAPQAEQRDPQVSAKESKQLGSKGPNAYSLQAKLKGLRFGPMKPVTCKEELAELFFAEIQKVQPSGPYILAGHSFGPFG